MTMTSSNTSSLDTRDRLIEGAVGLLHAHGYQSVGVKALCDVAGVQKGSFYHYFSSKEDLTLAALDRSWDLFRTGVIEPALAQNDDPAKRNRAIRAACLDRLSDHDSTASGPHGCMFGRLAASVTEGEPLLRARLAEIFSEWADRLGGGSEGWAALADILGRLVLAFTVEVSEVSET